ncbi:hypothetical protein HNQ02_003717 [Flavobacterium sp. 7E]|uniref:hypothetical protein n=1 Tax=unclassified Flavobacterium TaxID=196869 RepID=UPI00156D7FB9|nr:MULTISPECIES: hypothetical protein [unclassified Flavobacterium]MBE0393656.1 hypothetical protein [Flavobacterium sp. PL002]NRS90770.1 hypothetical protein [Flavobacterium sp. 7E]
MAENTERVLRIKSIDGDTRFHNVELKISTNLKLLITKEITGYTCQFIYGDPSDLDYESLVVPTYRLDVIKNGKVVTNYNVTRDSWYSRGVIKDNWGPNDDIELSNRCFEPFNENINLFSTVPTAYPPDAELDALALRQNKSEELKAVSHTKRMQTYVDGESIDDARKDLGIAIGVMIHVGGWFNNGHTNKLAGSYGCFGIVPKVQIDKTKGEAEAIRTSKGYKNYEPSNNAYKSALNFIIKGSEGMAIHVLIEKRDNVELLRTLKNQ